MIRWRDLGFALALLLYLAPLGWLAATAFKEREDVVAIPPRLVFVPTLQPFREVLFERGFLGALVNSLIVAAGSTLITMTIATFAAYGAARLRRSLKEVALLSFLSTRMVPPVVMVLPIYLLFQHVGLLDTRLAVILIHTLANTGFAVWILHGYFAGTPERLEEIALIDGHGRAGAFLWVVVPFVKPGVFVTGLFCFLFSWNEFLFASLLSAFEARTLPVGIPGLVTHTGTEWAQVGAVSLLSMLPALLVAVVAGARVLRGLSLSIVHEHQLPS